MTANTPLMIWFDQHGLQNHVAGKVLRHMPNVIEIPHSTLNARGVTFIVQSGEKHEVTGQDDQVFYADMVDDLAIVIPETVKALRALTARERDPDALMAKTDATPRVSATLM